MVNGLYGLVLGFRAVNGHLYKRTTMVSGQKWTVLGTKMPKSRLLELLGLINCLDIASSVLWGLLMGSNDQKGEDNSQVKKEILIVLCFSIGQRQFYRSATGLILDNVAPLTTDIQS